MTKYIIELEDDIKYLIINGRADNRCYTLVRPVAELEILNSDYINEHYGELQDEAYQRGLEDGKKAFDLLDAERDSEYQRGYEDGKNSTEKGCEGCKFESRTAIEEPCKYCSNCHTSKYTPMPKHSDRIEVGDEVVWNDGTTLTVTRVHKLDDDEWCDGMDEDGRMYGVLKNNVRKTGKHYDIASILEAMRT